MENFVKSAANKTEKNASQTEKNIVSSAVAMSREGAKQALTDILTSYMSASQKAKAEKDAYQADAALLSAKAEISVLKGKLGYSLGGEKITLENDVSFRQRLSKTEKQIRADAYSLLKIKSLKSRL